ncbi:hypothetical protein [Bacillus alkalisoli]|uniref:hypothetical protein n=1 Tax=Bacillus alkalisoli TaxID=2011008 RepID=UPI000C23175F|nr:hypothetical protein [Bacillus alkalisoli]
MKEQNNLEWLTPLKQRPDLYMDEKTAMKIEQRLRSGKKRNTIFFYVPVTFATIAAIVLLFTFLSSGMLLQRGSLYAKDVERFLAGKEILEKQDWDDMEREIKLPTQAPFEVEKVELNRDQFGPHHINEKGVVEYLDGDITVIEVTYFGQMKDKSVWMRLTQKGSEYERQITDEQKVDIRKDLKGFYWDSENVKGIWWEDGGAVYEIEITVFSPGGKINTDTIEQKEIIKIAQSFEVFKKKGLVEQKDDYVLTDEWKESLSAFDSVGRPYYHFTSIPFEVVEVNSEYSLGGNIDTVHVEYRGPDNKSIELFVSFNQPMDKDAPDLKSDFTEAVTSNGLVYYYGHFDLDKTIVVWDDGKNRFLVYLWEIEDVEDKIPTIIESMKIYEN